MPPPPDAAHLRRLGAFAFGAGPEAAAHGPRRLGNYELIEEIGRGGMGVVYLARQVGLERIVALKVLAGAHLATAEADARFQREAQLAARLRHPYLVSVHEIGRAQGTAFFSMDYIAGGDLAQRLRERAFQPREAAELLQKLAQAVAYAHREGVLHRDLKPSNILLEGLEPRIADFGLAAPLGPGGDLTLLTSVLGTPHYLAPEGFSAGSAALGPASDLYALGAILYELLTGRAPFAGTHSAELPAVVATAEPPAPRLFNPGVPRDLETICLRCLEKSPVRRYADAQALADDLGRFLAGDPILARPVSGPARFYRWCRRRPALAAAWLLLMALALGAAASAAIIARARRDATEQLRAALIAQARSARQTGQMGQRFEALAALQRAAGIRHGDDLRDEALTALALPDVRLARQWRARATLSAPVAFDAELQHYVTELSPGRLVLRRTADESELRRFAGLPEEPRAVYVGAFARDGSRFVARFLGGAVAVFSTSAEAPLLVLRERPALQPHVYFALDLWLSPDGRTVGCAHPEGGASLHEVETGAELGRFRLPGAESLPASVLSVSPDGSRLALIAHRGRSIFVFERATARLLRRLDHSAPLLHCTWHPDGRQLASSGVDNRIQLWDTESGERTGLLAGHRAVPIFLAFSPDGRLLASAGREFAVRLWDVAAQQPLLEIRELGGGAGLAFSADGRRLAFTSAEFEAVLLDLLLGPTRRVVSTLPAGDYFEETACLDFTACGRGAFLASRAGVRLVDAESGKVLAVLAAPADGPDAPLENRTVVVSPKGEAVYYSASASGIWRRALRWPEADLLVLGPPELLAKRTDFEVMRIDPTGSYLFLAGERSNRAAILPLPPATGGGELTLSGLTISGAFSPDGRLLLTGDYAGGRGNDADLKLWDTASGRLVRPLGFGADSSALSLPGTDLVLVGNSSGSALLRWPALETVVSKLPSGWPTATPDGNLLALQTERVRLYRLSDRRTLAHLPISDRAGLRFGPDGTKLFVHAALRFEVWDLQAARRELAALGLDWDDAPLPVPARSDRRLLRVAVE